MSTPDKNNIFAVIPIAMSLTSLLVVVISAVLFISNIDKTNAIQQAQIESINKRLDRVDIKLDQLIERHRA